jgi:hypothetical protein
MKMLFVVAAFGALIPAVASAQSIPERRAQIEANITKMRALENDYAACVKEQTVRLGKGNSEPSDNVVKAAFAKCEEVEKEFRNTSITTSVLAGEVMSMTEDADRYVAKMQSKATAPAIAALLEARTTN